MTRARAQASALAERLRGAGRRRSSRRRRSARGRWPSSCPTLAGYDLLCVTSPNGAERLFDHLRDARALAGVTVAAIGPGTARALRAHGIEPDVVPERAVAEGLVEALADVPVRRALIARAAEGRDVLPDALRERGAEVDVVALYETVAEPLDDATRDAGGGAPTTCCSPPPRPCASSPPPAARWPARAWPRSARRRAPSCAPTAPSRDLEADPHTPDGLVAALLADAVIVSFLSDYGPGDEYAGVVDGVIAAPLPARAGDRPRARRAAAGRAHRRAPARARAAVPAGRRAPGRGRPRRRRARGARSRCDGRRTGCSSAPTTGCCSRPRSGSAAWPRRSRSRARRGGSSPCRPRSTAATCSPPSPRGWPAARRSRTPASRSTRRRSSRLPDSAAARRRSRHRPRRWRSTGSAT